MHTSIKRISICLLLAFVATVYAGPEIPGAPQEQPIAITNATIHPVSSPVIESGTVIFDKGRITALGTNIAIPDGVKVIKAPGKHVYPSTQTASLV